MPDHQDGGSRTESARGNVRKLLHHRRFHDFDELKASIKKWDLDWRQLDKGPLDAELFQVGTGNALLTRVYFSRQFDQKGSSPMGTRTLGLIEENVDGTRWCRRELDDTP